MHAGEGTSLNEACYNTTLAVSSDKTSNWSIFVDRRLKACWRCVGCWRGDVTGQYKHVTYRSGPDFTMLYKTLPCQTVPCPSMLLQGLLIWRCQVWEYQRPHSSLNYFTFHDDIPGWSGRSFPLQRSVKRENGTNKCSSQKIMSMMTNE